MNDHVPEEQLPEEAQFRLTLIATVVVSGAFAIAFVIFLIASAVFYPGGNTAEWYTSWGTWAAGVATAAAFLITAMSVRVTNAQARADRRASAEERADNDMAQARLLVIYKVAIPDGLQSLAYFRVENRSNDVFFDVSVPFADSPCDVDGKLERRTPELVAADNRLHEHLPDGELLVPFRRHTDEEVWFTLVTLHTFDWGGIKFAVHYTDAAGRQWKQHYGGKIERVLTKDPVPVRKADRFQTVPQVRRITAEEIRVFDETFGPPFLDQKYDAEADMQANAQSIVADWVPVRRVGPLDIDADLHGMADGCVWLELSYAPRPHRLWHRYFHPRVEAIECHRGWSGGGPGPEAGIDFEVPASEVENLVEQVDQAIDYANQQFEENELSEAKRIVAEMGDTESSTEQSDTSKQKLSLDGLDELKARLSRPDYDE